MAKIVMSPEERFWLKVDKSGECWEWTAYKKPDGYGMFTAYSGTALAHRISYEMEHGPIADGLEIDHKCHNRACVKPAHLRATTHKKNTQNREGAQKNSTSGVRGVCWDKNVKKWRARVYLNRRSIHAGHFDDLAEADAAVRAKRQEVYSSMNINKEDV